MTPSLLLLAYGIGFYLAASYVLVDRPLARRLCARCGTPDREALIAVVAGVLWPVLVLAYCAGVVFWLLREYADVTMGPDRP